MGTPLHLTVTETVASIHRITQYRVYVDLIYMRSWATGMIELFRPPLSSPLLLFQYLAQQTSLLGEYRG